MGHKLIDEKPTHLLDEFLKNYMFTQKKVFNMDDCKVLIKNYFAYHNGKTQYKQQLSRILELEERWYESNCTDFSVYDDDYYFIDIWLCFVNFSRKYLKLFDKPNSIGAYLNASLIEISRDVKTVLDLGCGVGYSTATLKQLYPKSKVTGTNLKDTKQWKFCSLMSQKYDFELKSNVNDILENQDLVFASEYFEHIKNPIEHLDQVLKYKPKILVLANAFNTVALGHFTQYIHKDEIIDQKDISKHFNKHLRNKGYLKLKTKYWNNRPNVWIKEKDFD